METIATKVTQIMSRARLQLVNIHVAYQLLPSLDRAGLLHAASNVSVVPRFTWKKRQLNQLLLPHLHGFEVPVFQLSKNVG